jgi:hypothetical protein
LGIKIKHEDARTNLNLNTSESKKQVVHEKQTKIARKRHGNPTSFKWRINATMKDSIHLEVRFFTNGGKN